MELNTRASHFILASVKRIYWELPALVDDWESIQPEVDALIRQLEDTPNQHEASGDLLDLFSDSDAVITRIKQENTVQGVISNNIQQNMVAIAASLGFDVNTVDGLIAAAYNNMRWSVDESTLPDDEALKSITLKPGGVDGGQSVKFKNMKLDLKDFSVLAAGFITTGYKILDKPHPLLMAAGVLLTIAALHDSMKIELSEEEASVFWGFVVATSHKVDKEISEADILAATNAERDKYDLDALTDKQFLRALDKLERIHSIKKVGDDVWRIEEQYNIED